MFYFSLVDQINTLFLTHPENINFVEMAGDVWHTAQMKLQSEDNNTLRPINFFSLCETS